MKHETEIKDFSKTLRLYTEITSLGEFTKDLTENFRWQTYDRLKIEAEVNANRQIKFIKVDSNRNFKLKSGKFKGSIGKWIGFRPNAKNFNFCTWQLEFKDGSKKSMVGININETKDTVTNLNEYSSKIPKFLTNKYGQELAPGDNIMYARSNKIYFGVIKGIVSAETIEIKALQTGNDKRRSIRQLRDIKNVIKWDENLDFETQVAHLVLMH